MFMLNVLSVISLTKAVLPHMLDKKQGQVVIISSIAGKIGTYQSQWVVRVAQ
jgi:short-subunit dehydrogenase